MKLTFYGGIGETTGSNYLLESGGKTGGNKVKILIDCGLHQGGRDAERRNFEDFPYDPKEIEAVFITHAHLDHIGRLPKLLREGFHGTIYSTEATKDFADLMLIDSAHLLSEAAEREHLPPLYGEEEIAELKKYWHALAYHEQVSIGNGEFVAELFDAGHILGSAFVRIQSEGKTIVFSGDLGNSPAPIIQPTEKIDYADYCLIESTYGDRIHKDVDRRRDQLEAIIQETAKAGGTLVIPTFAMERTQELLYHLHQLFEEGRIPPVPVFIDSPLAIKLTAIYKKFENSFNKDTYNIAKKGEDILNFPGLKFTLTTEQSKEINNVPPPKIVIAGSGMSNGGRVLHHEQRYLPEEKSTIIFVGYQAKGTLGREILDGAKEVKIYGETVPVRSRVVNIPGYSAHADQPKLLEWLAPMRHSLKKVFVVQGEEESSETLARLIRDDLAVSAEVPKFGESVVL